MAVYDKIYADLIFPYGEENAVASFYKWMNAVFGDTYAVFFDHDGTEFTTKKLTKFPSITVQQIDTQDMVTSYIGGKNNHMQMLFYIYFNHSLKSGGTRRLLRRGRDQIMTALKLAGVQPKGATDIIFPPIELWDFSKSPIASLGGYMTVNSGVQQRFIQEDDVLQQELMVSLSYMERLYT